MSNKHFKLREDFSIEFWGVKMVLNDVKDHLLQKLYFSLPIEEQHKIMVDVLKETSDRENKCPNCGKKLDEVKNGRF